MFHKFYKQNFYSNSFIFKSSFVVICVGSDGSRSLHGVFLISKSLCAMSTASMLIDCLIISLIPFASSDSPLNYLESRFTLLNTLYHIELF